MQIIKFIGAGVFALFALSTVVKLLGTFSLIVGGGGNSYMMGRLLGGVFGVILWGVLAYLCWKSAAKSRMANDTASSPLPEVTPNKR
jgi:hypothetical protein